MIFVTGGTGMVGSHLLFDLTSRGEKVRALKRSESQIQRTEKIFACYSSEYQSLLKNIEWVDGDILDKDRLRQLLDGVDQIYHAAAVISFLETPISVANPATSPRKDLNPSSVLLFTLPVNSCI